MSTTERGPTQRRRIQVIFKVTEEERDKLKAGAKRAGQRYSTWARTVLLREAGEGGEGTQAGRAEEQATSVSVPEVRPD